MGFLSDIMLKALEFFAFFGGYGWGIIWLTIAVNLALYPLTLSSVKSMSAMQRMQPKLQEIQKKYKDDPQEMQKQTMAMYKSEKINPLGGCLPVLLKIPFFLALFWAFQSTAFMQIASNPENNTAFLWITGRVGGQQFQSEALVKQLVSAKVIIKDEADSQKSGSAKFVWNAALEVGDKHLKDVLNKIDPKNVEDLKKVQEQLKPVVGRLSDEDLSKLLNAWDRTNNLAKPDRVDTPLGRISILALLIGITTFAMQKSMPTGGGQQGQMMALFMPVFITFICWNFPAGVQLYWLVSNGVGALQQFYIMRKPARRPAKKEAAK